LRSVASIGRISMRGIAPRGGAQFVKVYSFYSLVYRIT
jgi:hypothetical protein